MLGFGAEPQKKEKTGLELLAEREEIAAELVAKAKEAETEANSHRAKLLQEFTEEYRADYDGFAFECKRWGDFLTIMVKRLGHEGRGDGKRSIVRSHATAVNIRETRELRLDKGAMADSNGTLGYTVHALGDNGGTWWGTGFGYRRIEGATYKVTPRFPHVPYRQMFSLDDSEDRHHGLICEQDRIVRYRTEGFPRPAEDDRIRFEGIRATLFCPFGHGDSVYKTILTEIGDYAAR